MSPSVPATNVPRRTHAALFVALFAFLVTMGVMQAATPVAAGGTSGVEMIAAPGGETTTGLRGITQAPTVPGSRNLTQSPRIGTVYTDAIRDRPNIVSTPTISVNTVRDRPDILYIATLPR